MRNAWRWLLFVWLVLALPLQGAVAATLRHCAMAGAATVQADTSAHHHHGLAHDGAAVVDAGHVHHHDASALPAQSDHADHAGQCSVCAACCPAMAPVMPMLDGPAPQVSALRYGALAASPPPEGCLSGLERPPRVNLA